VAERIRGQVLQCLLESLRIAPHLQILGINPSNHRDPMVADEGTVAIENPAEKLRDCNVLEGERSPAALEPRQVEQIADQL
jgi:hypothetical protein